MDRDAKRPRQGATILIASLNPFTKKDCTLRARLVDLTPSRDVQTRRGTASVRSATLRDAAGAQMLATFWGSKFASLQADSVVDISRFQVRFAQRAEAKYLNSYELSLDEASASVAQVDDDASISRGLQCSFSNLRQVAAARAGGQVDVAGLVMEVGELLSSTRGAETIQRREVHLCDPTMHQFALTVWGAHAAESGSLQVGEVLVARRVLLSDFRGGRKGSVAQTGDVFCVPADAGAAAAAPATRQLDETGRVIEADLRAWWGAGADGSRVNEVMTNISEPSEFVDQDESLRQELSIREVKALVRQYAGSDTPVAIDSCWLADVVGKTVEGADRAQCYTACTVQVDRQFGQQSVKRPCHKKVVDGQCREHGSVGGRSQVRWLPRAQVADPSDTMFISLAHDDAARLFGMRAEDFQAQCASGEEGAAERALEELVERAAFNSTCRLIGTVTQERRAGADGMVRPMTEFRVRRVLPVQNFAKEGMKQIAALKAIVC